MNTYLNKLFWLMLLLVATACYKEESGFKRYHEPAVLPNARFKITMIENCQPPYRVHFQNLTTDTFGNEKYVWDYGNGDTSHTKMAAVASYKSAGEYHIKLLAINDVGIDTFDTLVVMPTQQDVVADFEFGSAYGAYFWEPCPVQFTNLSQHAKTYTWEFGDNLTSTEENPLHVFWNKGQYVVTLFSECGGQEESVYKTITIAGPPRVFTITELHLLFLPEKYMNDIDTADGTLGLDLFFEAYLGSTKVLTGSVVKGVDGPKQFPVIWKSNTKISISDYSQPLLIRYYDDDFNGRPQFIATMTIDMQDLQNNYYPDSYSKFDQDDLETKLFLQWKNQ
ncbi:PKD domain-containing protein [bacterium]|nr:PKD domain-containing protein [bacterium]